MKPPHIVLLAGILGSSGTTHAATTVISQPAFTTLADFAPTGFGQSFTATGNHSITAINLYMSSSAGGSDITLRLYSFDSQGSKLGNVGLATGYLRESELSPTPGWETVTLFSPFNIVRGATYAFTVIAKDPGGSATGWNNYGVSPDAYAGGNSLSLGSGGSVTKNTSDLTFQVVAVPEPATSSLLAAALSLTTFRRTRTRIRRPEC